MAECDVQDPEQDVNFSYFFSKYTVKTYNTPGSKKAFRYK